MTVAVCLQCGEFKRGAFNPCPKCGYAPNDDESLTKHLLVTDHYHSREALASIALRIKSGKPLEFDPEMLKAAWVSKEKLDAGQKRMNRSCLIGCGVVLVLVVVVVVVLITQR